MFYGGRLSHRLRDRHLTNVTDDNVRIALGMLSFVVIAAMAICASIAHNFFIRAYAIGEASVIAPIDYVRLLASAAVDFLIFGIIFGLNTLIGSSIIILSTLYIVRREAKIQKNKKQEFEQI